MAISENELSESLYFRQQSPHFDYDVEQICNLFLWCQNWSFKNANLHLPHFYCWWKWCLVCNAFSVLIVSIVFYSIVNYTKIQSFSIHHFLWKAYSWRDALLCTDTDTSLTYKYSMDSCLFLYYGKQTINCRSFNAAT